MNAQRTMTAPLALAIAASAWNVCGPRSGTPATPATVRTLDRTRVLTCVALYADAHDGTLYSPAEIDAARAMLEG